MLESSIFVTMTDIGGGERCYLSPPARVIRCRKVSFELKPVLVACYDLSSMTASFRDALSSGGIPVQQIFGEVGREHNVI